MKRTSIVWSLTVALAFALPLASALAEPPVPASSADELAASPALETSEKENAAAAAAFPGKAAEPDAAADESPLIQPAWFCDNCSGNYNTAIHWGGGSNCSLAFQNLSYQIVAAANAFCVSIGRSFSCSGGVVVTQACYYAHGQWVVDGRLNHGCASFC